LSTQLVAIGPDDRRRPVQPLSTVETPPIFEGEFSAAELGQYLGGLDPATPLFGKYLAGLTARALGPGLMQLDVGLADAPAPTESLVRDQAELARLLPQIEKFKIVVHDAVPIRRVLVQAGAGVEAGIARITLEAGQPDPSLRPAAALGDDAITNGVITVRAQPDGTVVIDDGTRRVRANDLVDEGDRGDLYHAELVGAPLRATATRISVVESGPLRACLRVGQVLEVPAGLEADRRSRRATRPLAVTTEIAIVAGERRVDFTTTFVNEHEDHRLRAIAHAPYEAERFEVEHGLCVVPRPFDTLQALGVGAERAAPTAPHHLFVDVGAAGDGLALMSRGLFEHEVARVGGATTVALTLLRAVGWLARGDLEVVDHAVGPIVPTPEAQELGAHRCEYSLLLHAGDWRAGNVLSEARRYAAPPITVKLRGARTVPTDVPLVRVAPADVVVTGVDPAATALSVRVLNTSAKTVRARLAPHRGCTKVRAVDPLGREVAAPVVEINDGAAVLELRPWQLATVELQ
jgi:hypothetical protein